MFTPWSDKLITVVLWAKEGRRFCWLVSKSVFPQQDFCFNFLAFPANVVASLRYSSYIETGDEMGKFIGNPGIARLSLAAVRSCWARRVPFQQNYLVWQPAVKQLKLCSHKILCIGVDSFMSLSQKTCWLKCVFQLIWKHCIAVATSSFTRITWGLVFAKTFMYRWCGFIIFLKPKALNGTKGGILTHSSSQIITNLS